MTDIRYIVVPEKRLVVALTQYHGRTVRASAKCADNDEFDVETGKELATRRLRVRVLNKRLRFALNRSEELDAVLEMLNDLVDKYNDKFDRNEDHIAELNEDLEDALTELDKLQARL